MIKIEREMVLFPSEEQFNEKSDELEIGRCYWTIPHYPRDKKQLIGSKLYFYDKQENRIAMRVTVVAFEEVEGKKAVFFQFQDDDSSFELWFDKLKSPKRKQTRGWCYRWFKISKET